MSGYIAFNALGAVQQRGRCDDGYEHMQVPGATIFITDNEMADVYFNGTEVLQVPSNSDERKKFDTSTGQWVFKSGKDIEGAFVSAVQQVLDNTAKLKGYDDIRSAALRAGYPGPFHDEGVAYAQWMDSCWDYCYSAMALVISGARPMPTTSELVSELPSLQLP